MNYGKHLMLRINNIENIDSVNNEEELKKFLTELTHRINMRVLVPPVVGYEEGEAENIGYSGVVILYESHIAIHIYSETHQAFIDVFSCKDYEEKDIYKFLTEKVGNYNIKEKTILNRGRHWDTDIKKELKKWGEKR